MDPVSTADAAKSGVDQLKTMDPTAPAAEAKAKEITALIEKLAAAAMPFLPDAVRPWIIATVAAIAGATGGWFAKPAPVPEPVPAVRQVDTVKDLQERLKALEAKSDKK